MTNFTVPLNDLVVNDGGNLLDTYSFGSGVAKQHFCKNCGIYVFHEARSNPGSFRINIGCIGEVEPYELPSSIFNGKEL